MRSTSQDQAPLLTAEDLEASPEASESARNREAEAAPQDEESCGSTKGKIRDYIAVSVAGKMVLAVSPEQRQRAIMCVTTILMLTDQWLDGGVVVSLRNGLFKSLSLVLVSSVIAPQIIAWGFLWQNSMTSGWGLVRALIFPLLGAAVLIYFRLAGGSEQGPWHDVALFSMVVSFEPIYNLYKGCVAGKEVDEAFWTSIAEGLIEAPASAALTLYPAMLLSVHSHEGPSWLFMLSSVFSLAMVTRASTKLHFYGLSNIGVWEYAKTLLFMKFPQVMSQVLGFVFFAFLSRPLPEGIGDSTTTEEDFADEIRNKNLSWLVFVFLFHEIALNFSLLKTASPDMRPPIAALFATTMVVSGPPGFLQAFDGARVGHATQHFVGLILMAAVAVSMASEAHWSVLTSEYAAFATMFVICVPWAFLASIFMHKDTPLEQRVRNAQSRLGEALKSNDRLMARLLVDVEGVDVDSFFHKAAKKGNTSFLRVMVEFGLVSSWAGAFDKAIEEQRPDDADLVLKIAPEARDHANSKRDAALEAGDGQALQQLAGAGTLLESSLDRALSESDRDVARLLLDAGARPRQGFLLADGSWLEAYLDTGSRGQGGAKWHGACACNGRVFFCPHDAREVMVLDPSTGALTFIETGRGHDEAHKWEGVCACDGRVFFCPHNDAEVMVLDPSTGSLTFIETGRGRGGSKWSGTCACDGRVFFCPDGDTEVMVLDPSTGALTFIETGRGQGGGKWHGACVCDGRVFFCPHNDPEVMVLDPSTEALTFIDTSRHEGGGKWHTACACDGRVFFCPDKKSEVMVLDPSTGALTFIDHPGRRKGPNGWAEWHGACACDGRVFFCPHKNAEVMVLDPSTGALTFIETGSQGGGKWEGACACDGRVFFCPFDAAEVLQVPAVGCVDRLGRLRELGLERLEARWGG